MDSILYYVCIPFGWLMRMCVLLVKNYGIAILLFTLISKILLLPLSVWIHKNSILMVKLQPQINFIKVKFFGDGDMIAEEQSRLFKKHKYRPLVSLIPLAIQIFLLMAVIYIIENPLEYLPVSSVYELNASFLGFDLFALPSESLGKYIFVPLVAGVSAWGLCFAQNKSNVIQHEQGAWNKYGLMAVSVGLSLYLGCFVPTGVALYWIAGNVLAIVQLYVLNAVINPKRYVDYAALEESRKALAGLEELGGRVSRENRRRERCDYKRFFKIVNKHLVIYSEKSGFYKYFKDIIAELQERSNIVIHYITNDPDDIIFKIAEENSGIKPYYIGIKKAIPLMMKLEADMVIMTTPDFNKMYLKRSIMKKDVEYVYIPHDTMSVHMGFREGAFDDFDTVFCTGAHVEREIRAIEEHYGLPRKNLVKFGYPLADELAARSAESTKRDDGKKQILIAPSWQEDNLLDSCIDELLSGLLREDYRVIVRPHPEYLKRYPARMKSIEEKYADKVGEGLIFQLDFSDNEAIYSSDLLITDWSGIAPEFCFATGRAAIFVNTAIKCRNPNWRDIGIEPVEISLREKIGIALDKSELCKIGEYTQRLLESGDEYRERIALVYEEHLYNHGKAASAGAKYILSRLMEKAEERNKK